MWYAYIGKLFSKIGAQLTAAGAAVFAVLLLIFGHRRAVDNAEKRGAKIGTAVERDRISRETIREQMTIKESARETRQKYADLDSDELRRRMRASASDK